MRSRRLRWTPPFARLAALDLAAFRWVARLHVPILDRLLPRLSTVANRSVLWMLISGALAAFGGRQGRRAASRGMLSIALTSFTVNLPAKLITRRERPLIDVVPEARRVARIPVSSSFPSGHSASAFAFATGASLELPRLATPLSALAGAVAFSRVYTGVHYPGDVLVGSAMGAGIALGTKGIWPELPDDPPVTRSLEGDAVRLSPTGEGLSIVVNLGSGNALASDPCATLEEALPDARIVRAEGSEVDAALEEAARSSTAIVIAGGDGSVNAAAALAVREDKPLVVIPAGTLNHLARDLGIDDPQDAIEGMHKGRPVALDVATIADRVFVNTASFGSYVDLVDARGVFEEKIGKWPAVVVALLKVLRTSEPIDVEIDGRRQRVWMAFFGNCRYHPSGFAPSWRSRLDDGKLDVRIVDAASPWARTRLVLSVLSGRLGRSRVYRQYLADEVDVVSKSGPLRVSLDGETFDGPERFKVSKPDRKLAVYVPEHELPAD